MIALARPEGGARGSRGANTKMVTTGGRHMGGPVTGGGAEKQHGEGTGFD